MKFVNYVSAFFFIQCIVFMTGCNKVAEWGKENFKQADRYDEPITKHMVPYLRTTIVYDQLTTVADFAALFLTDAARMLYVDYYIQRHTISKEKESVMRQRLLNENKYYISFYILGSQAENLYPNNRALFTGRYYKHQVLLGEKDSEWQVSLCVKDQEYVADSVRVVELPIEYQHFFGINFSQFKGVYMVKFDALDDQDHEILTSGYHTISLKFSSARYKTKLTWKDVIYTAR